MYENLLWVNKRAFCAFDSNFKLIKYGRKKENLPKYINNIITHNEYYEYHYNTFTKQKVELNILNMRSFIDKNKYEEIYVSVSGGKDSTVCKHISDNVFDNELSYKCLFINTTNETHYTYQYVKKHYKNNLTIINPDVGYYDWCKDNKFIPTRFSRACCNIFKEGNIQKKLDSSKKILHICGVRKDESSARSDYSVVRKGKWNKKATENWDMYLPILDFNDLDIYSYIFKHNLELNPLYKFGYNRVGCTNCPYRSTYELELNEYFLPTYDKRWKKILKDIFIECGIAINLNCTIDEFVNGAWRAGVVREFPTEEVIEEFAQYKNKTIEEARKFFKSNTCDCGKRLSKDIIALNMKLFGRNTEGRKCLKCMSEILEISKKELEIKIQDFKKLECNLFS